MTNGEPKFLWIWTLTVVLCGGLVESIKEQNCTQVKCPPMSEIHCPSDSYSHEFQEFTAISTDEEHRIVEEVFVNCCISKKCSCRECIIPSCHNSSLVLYEIELGSDMPGKCCAKYDCIFEPNCTDAINTSGYWLIDCQRCKCLAGQKICHRSCDEMRSHPANCLSQNLTVFKNGQTWKEDECTQCECQNGEKKCQTSFCRPLDCPSKVKPEGECCPVCTIENPDGKESKDGEVTPIPMFPCQTTDSYSVHTEIIEVVVPSKQNCILYGIIVALAIILVIFIALYLHERSKQRSYRPVSALDDNFNKITGKIKSKEFTYA